MPLASEVEKRRAIGETIVEMRSQEDLVRLKALAKVRARGWLHDGSLEGANLRGVILTGEDLSEAKLQGAILAGAKLVSVSLVKADLRGVHLWDPERRTELILDRKMTRRFAADLRGADLSGADVRGAYLSGANLEDVRGLTDNQLAQVTSARGATMPDGSQYDGRFILPGDMPPHPFDRLDSEMVANWYGVSLAAYLRGQGWAQEHLPERPLIWEMGSQDNSAVLCAVEALRAGGWLVNGSLEGVWLGRANLEGADLHDASLRRAHLSAANLARADLSNADLRGAWLGYASLIEANLTDANLQKATMHAHLSKAVLVRANLQGVAIRGGDLRGADLTGANLTGADLYTRLQNVIGLSDRQLAHVNMLLYTTMPDGKRYDGRYALPSELEWARRDGIDTEDPAAMAEFYGVPLEEYLHGQEWAKINLSEIRSEGGESAE